MSNLKHLGWALVAKASIVTASVLTYVYHSELKKLEYTLFEKNLPIAENAYNSPPILDVDWQVNDDGMIETYLVNSETGKKVEILYDMLPSNSTMIEAMGRRVLNGHSEKSRQQLPNQPANLEAVLYNSEVRK